MLVGTLLLLGSFVILLVSAFVFTNAVEWAGVRLHLGHGAVGSILAAVATAMPESLIPVVAIMAGGSGREAGGEIAVGAILGAPFLLSTLAMALCGVAALVFRSRRRRADLKLDRDAMAQDLIVFMCAFGLAVALGLVRSRELHTAGAVVLVAGYGLYVWRTITRGIAEGSEEELSALFFHPGKKTHPPRNITIIAQAVVSLVLLLGGAQLFVTQVEHIAREFQINALVLALVLAPLASELPEKLNSVLWISQGKDTLALGNITGAMVFQSMLPVSVGLLFTDWRLSAPALVAAGAALTGSALALVTVLRTGRFTLPFVAAWLALYTGAIAVIVTMPSR
jgi:cation:H+ antiporter